MFTTMSTIFLGAFAGSLAGLVLGYVFGEVGAGTIPGPGGNREPFIALAALVGWAAGGVIGAVGTAAQMIIEAVRAAAAGPPAPGPEVPPEGRPR
jgi:hypothetical protein